MRHWLGLSQPELSAWIAEQKQPAFRAKQLADWLHAKRVISPDRMANIPAALRLAVAENGCVRSFDEVDRKDARDGLTSKWLLSSTDDASRTLVESVLIIEKELRRRTVCVSSMAGCPLDCAFCATGRNGFVRNLSAGEIIEQAYRADAYARSRNDAPGVSHIVFMGMGEPLLNLDAVLPAAERFADPVGLGLSGRHITISTAGIPDGIRELARRQVTYRLAISLHAPNQAIREKIMPVAKRWPLPEIFDALDAFSAIASRALTFEYCLIDGVNATVPNAKELAGRIRRYQCKVNLIPESRPRLRFSSTASVGNPRLPDVIGRRGNSRHGSYGKRTGDWRGVRTASMALCSK
jgi:23S rRNA m2A2503 methyltransferase